MSKLYTVLASASNTSEVGIVGIFKHKQNAENYLSFCIDKYIKPDLFKNDGFYIPSYAMAEIETDLISEVTNE